MLKTQLSKVFTWNTFTFVPILFVTILFSPIQNATPADSSPKEVRVVNLKATFDAPKVTLNKRQLQFAKSYIRKNSEDLVLIKKRSKLPFTIMDSVFSRYGLPVELKYLAVIESELKSSARSRVGAMGPWQLMAETAHDWGLKITHRNDERTSFGKSTAAAAKYLKYLYSQFDDWLLVLAAYNSGAGRVCSAIRKSGSRNFWALQHYLPLETRLHVRRFIATHYYFEKQGGTTTLTKAENVEYKKTVNAYAAFRLATSSPNNDKIASLTGNPYLNVE